MQVIRGEQIDFVPASHEDPSDPGVLKRVLASRDDLLEGRVQMVNWSRLPAGKSFRPHYHEDMQEVFILIRGSVRMNVEQQSCELNAGDAILVAPREIHEMHNPGNEPAEYLVFGISTGEGGQTVVVSEK